MNLFAPLSLDHQLWLNLGHKLRRNLEAARDSRSRELNYTACRATELSDGEMHFSAITSCRRDRAAARRETTQTRKKAAAPIVLRVGRRRRRWPRRRRWRRRRCQDRRVRRWCVPPPTSRWICNTGDDCSSSSNHKNCLWRRRQERRRTPRLHRPPTRTSPAEHPSPGTSSCPCRLRPSGHQRATFRPARRPLYRSRRWKVSRSLKFNSLTIFLSFVRDIILSTRSNSASELSIYLGMRNDIVDVLKRYH